MKSPRFFLFSLVAALLCCGQAFAATKPTLSNPAAVPKPDQPNGDGHAVVSVDVATNGLKTLVRFYYGSNQAEIDSKQKFADDTVEADLPGDRASVTIPTDATMLQHPNQYIVRAVATNSASPDGSVFLQFTFRQNVAPVANPITTYVPKGSVTHTIYVTEADPAKPGSRPAATDPDGDALTISITKPPTKGTAVTAPGGKTITYTPGPDFAGNDSFTYTVSDGPAADGFLSTSATVSIVNNAPVATADRFSVSRTSPTLLNVLANDKDEEKAKLEFETRFPKQLPGGTVRLVERNGREQLEFTPNSQFTGVEEFTYVIRDVYGVTAEALVRLFSGQALAEGTTGVALKDASGKIVGYLRLDALANGAFTARIELGNKKYRLVGAFDADGQFTGAAMDEDGGFLPLTVGISLNDSGSPTITADLGAGEYTAEQTLGTLTSDGLAELEGRYTVELPTGTGTTTPADGTTVTETDGTMADGTTTDTTGTTASGPEGTGWMSIKVGDDGRASIKGKTGDGRAFSARAVVGGTDAAPELIVYATPNSGTLAGTLKLGETISGSLAWSRGETGATFYPEGFDLTVSAKGARWEKPEGGRRSLASDTSDADRATITISGGDIDGFSRQLRLSEKDKVEVLNPGFDDIGVKIRRKDGTFSGAFTDLDDDDRHIRFSGVLLQSTGAGSGVFQGRDKAGTVKISIATSTAETAPGTTTDRARRRP